MFLDLQIYGRSCFKAFYRSEKIYTHYIKTNTKQWILIHVFSEKVYMYSISKNFYD